MIIDFCVSVQATVCEEITKVFRITLLFPETAVGNQLKLLLAREYYELLVYVTHVLKNAMF